MGTGWQITCGNCGHLYEANSGGGMTGSYRYCDDCGKAEFIPYHFNLKEMQEGKTPAPAGEFYPRLCNRPAPSATVA